MPFGDTPALPVEDVLGKIHVQVAVSRRLKIDSTWSYDLKSPFWRLYVIDKAGASILYEGKELRLAPQRIYLIPAWVRFQCKATRSVMQDFMHFYVTGLPPTLLRRFFHRPLLLGRDAVLEALFRRWHDQLSSPAGLAEVGWAAALAHAAVATAAQKLDDFDRLFQANSWKIFSPIGPALDCIEQRISRPPSNPELARLCRLSTDRFIDKFHRIVGMTPARYGLERRISVAAQWLTVTSLAIEEIADAAGFTDRFHFSRAFKAHLGLPPVAYRRLHHASTKEARSLI